MLMKFNFSFRIASFSIKIETRDLLMIDLLLLSVWTNKVCRMLIVLMGVCGSGKYDIFKLAFILLYDCVIVINSFYNKENWIYYFYFLDVAFS